MKKKYIYMVTILTLVIGLFGISFGYLKDIKESSSNTNITISNFGVQFANGKNVGVVSFPGKTYPMTDTEGLNNPSITFGIENVNNVAAAYTISLVDGDIPSTMKNKDVRYQLKKGINGATPTVVGIFTLSDDGVIDTGTIDYQGTIDYELTMWIDLNANPNGLSFSKYVAVDGMQAETLDLSGANFPELADNMIPVYYDDTNSVWKKADSKNKSTNYKWFDYNNQMWANAVTVKENGTQTRDYYLNADNGTTIVMDDITTMWVWIPRFKYTIFNGNNKTSDEQQIIVNFEHGIASTGTYDETNTITNNKSTYTHPAFTFGEEKLTGFWMAKFEASTDDANCSNLETINATNCNKSNLNILVKPDQYSLRYINVSNMFSNIRKMETYENIHGFNQNTSATTVLNSSSNLTGEINNDTNTIDTHMIKNNEWGAVSILAHSKYGKNSEISINSMNGYKTGYSETTLYNDATSGVLASTTGTVSGVYDMSGGASEYTMANMKDSTSAFQVSSAGTWTSSIKPLTKYYDSYDYGTTGTDATTLSRGHLGDGTKEFIKNITSTTGRWYNDSNIFMSNTSSWSLRGGSLADGTSAGIFASSSATGDAIESASSRPVLIVSRNLPWLNN